MYRASALFTNKKLTNVFGARWFVISTKQSWNQGFVCSWAFEVVPRWRMFCTSSTKKIENSYGTETSSGSTGGHVPGEKRSLTLAKRFLLAKRYLCSTTELAWEVRRANNETGLRTHSPSFRTKSTRNVTYVEIQVVDVVVNSTGTQHILVGCRTTWNKYHLSILRVLVVCVCGWVLHFRTCKSRSQNEQLFSFFSSVWVVECVFFRVLEFFFFWCLSRVRTHSLLSCQRTVLSAGSHSRSNQYWSTHCHPKQGVIDTYKK